MDQLINTVQVGVWVVTVPLALKLLKGLFLTDTVQVHKNTDNGEAISFTKSFSVWHGAKHKAKATAKLFEAGDLRMEQQHQRLQEIIKKSEQEQKSKLKSV